MNRSKTSSGNSKRNLQRLDQIRKLPCVCCGQSPSQAAHSNSSKHGKGRGIKADDQYTVPLCHNCHALFDQFKLGNREESEALFEKWHLKTERMLSKDDEVF